MRSGVHKDKIKDCLVGADLVICKRPQAEWDLAAVLADFQQPVLLVNEVDEIITGLVSQLKAGDHVIVMSNSGFGGIHQKLLDAISSVAM